MKTLMMFLSITILLAGCASKPDYRPASKGSAGYSEHKISDDKYRVQFKVYSKSVGDATDYALLRSAQLTQQQGFDWFVVTTKETFVESTKMQPAATVGVSQSRQTVRDCGLLTCDTYERPSSQIGASISTGSQSDRKEVQTILEIRMGKGTRPNDDSYHAQDVIDNLRTKLEE